MTVEQFFGDIEFDVKTGKGFLKDNAVAYLRPRPELYISDEMTSKILAAIGKDESIEFIRDIALTAWFTNNIDFYNHLMPVIYE